jgi:protein ImuB
MTRRYLSLWFARLSSDRARVLREQKGTGVNAPLATYAKIKGAQKLVCVDRPAARLGLTPGLPLADARARHPQLIAVEAEPAAEAALLARIADWSQRFTPLVALDGADGIMLDIAGVAPLFGGETAMAGELETRLAAQGLGARAAIADFPRAAWALARFSREKIAPPGATGKVFAQMYHALPLAALGLDETIVADLARAGLRRIGDIALRPRAPIAARFGEDVIARLDALSGLTGSSINPRFPAPDFSVERRFASPLFQREAVEGVIAHLAKTLASLLQRQAKGARRLEVVLFRVDGLVRRLAVGASRPLNDAGAIARLFRERFEAPNEDELDPGYGFDVIRLSCLLAEDLAPSQSDFARPAEEEKAEELAALLDRLSARLGARRVTRLDLVDTHIPEYAVVATPATSSQARQATIAETRIRTTGLPTRPLRLFERPEPIEAVAEVPDGPPLRFKWRRVLHEIAAIEGPERIAAEWRRRPGGLTRDYFRAEDTQGRRFWLYREGLYGREVTAAKWYMHGLFG